MEALIYWWRLGRAQRARSKTQALYDDLIDAARTEHSENSGEVNSLIAEYFAQDNVHQIEIAKLQGSRLQAQAERLMLAPVDYADPRTWHDEEARWGVLSRSAITELRSRVRREQHEATQGLYAAGGFILGILGLLVALVSVLTTGS